MKICQWQDRKKEKITIICCIRQRQSQPSAACLYPVCELLMAASQALLSLFSCPIHNISEKHIERGPQGTREGLICYRRCDPLQDLIIDRYCRKGSEAAEHTVLLWADHVIISRKLQETVQDLTMNITKNVSERAQSHFTLDEAHHFKSMETLIHFYVYSHKVLTCKEAEWFQSTSEKMFFSTLKPP